MAKKVSRVIGRNGESMWMDDDVVHFKSGNVDYEADSSSFDRFVVMNVEDARKVAKKAGDDAVGIWSTKDQSSNGKTSLLVGTGKGILWIMEVTKNQAPNAATFAHAVCPSNEEDEPEYKLYAAIQTPKGALFTVGSIACAIAAYFVLERAQMPLLVLVLAGLSIFMFVNIK